MMPARQTSHGLYARAARDQRRTTSLWVGALSVVVALLGFVHAQSSTSDVQVVSIAYDLGNNVVAPPAQTLSMTNVSPERVRTPDLDIEYTLSTGRTTLFAEITEVGDKDTATHSPSDVGLADPNAAVGTTTLRDSALVLSIGRGAAGGPGGKEFRLNDEDTWFPVALERDPEDGASILLNYGQAATHDDLDIFFALERPGSGPQRNLDTTVTVTFTIEEGD